MIKLTAKHYEGSIKASRRDWPKYYTQVLNLANSTAQSCLPRRVGPVVHMFQEMIDSGIVGTLQNWENYYKKNVSTYCDGKNSTEVIDEAVNRTWKMLGNMLPNGHHSTKEEVRTYIEEIIYNKTHMGNSGQYCAAEALSSYYQLPIKWPTPYEDSAGQIDMWLDKIPVQVKPHKSAFKSHVHNHADTDKHLYVTYEKKNKKWITYIHNPDFIQSYNAVD